MNIAFLHYHLDTGGVTRVIENHLRAIDAVATSPVQVAVLHGGRTSGWQQDRLRQLTATTVSLQAVPALEYDQGRPASPAELAAAIRVALARLSFRPDDTLLHVHNHSLGKNVSLPAALCELAAEGWRMLLQIHDFSEDFRPTNYRRQFEVLDPSTATRLYPQAPHVHYAVLNRRDLDVLQSAGVDLDRLHHLPNPAPAPLIAVDSNDARQRLADRFGVEREKTYTLYPVRGIRRKNLGEAVLLSILDEPGSIYGVALPPQNRAAKPIYDRWKMMAAELKSPVRFGVCDVETGGLTYGENLAAADAAVTTSVAEGFGMAFLEPWLSDLPLFGRDLPAITSDYRGSGLQLDHCYDRLPVPVEWVGRRRLVDAFQTSGNALLTAYGRATRPSHEWSTLLDRKLITETVDFGDLNESLQECVIRRAAGSSNCRNELRSMSPSIALRPTPETIAANAACIRRAYGLEPIGSHLLDTYRCVISGGVGPTERSDIGPSILDRFLDLSDFRLIRDI